MTEKIIYPGGITRDEWDTEVLRVSDLILDLFKTNNISPAVASVAMQKTQTSMLFIISHTFQDAMNGLRAHAHSCEKDMQVLYSAFGEEKLSLSPEDLEEAIRAKADELIEKLA